MERRKERRKERTVEDLLRTTKKLTHCRPSCVLEGKARMRGPGVEDAQPSDDSVNLEVCDICGSEVRTADLQTCSACDREFHSSCLEPPTNASVGVDWHCSGCQGKSDSPQPASEASLPSSSGIHGKKEMACTLDSRVESQDELDEVLSSSQDPSGLGSKPALSTEGGVKKTPEQSDSGQKDVTDTAGGSEPEEAKKSMFESGDPIEQPPNLEYVRRSKRGRPYKPVGGLHPNKRRSVDSSTSRQTEKTQQGRSRTVVDEEDELGAKIEKFRVISTIDVKSARKEPPGLEDSKKADVGQEDSVPAKSVSEGLPVENAETVLRCEIDTVVNDVRIEEDKKITRTSPKGSVAGLSPVSTVHDAGKTKSNGKEPVSKAKDDTPECLSGGSVPPNGVKGDEVCEIGQSPQAENQLSLCEEQMRAEFDAKASRQEQLTSKCSATMQSPTLHDIVDNKFSRKSSGRPLDTNLGMRMVEKVHLASPRLEPSGSVPTPLDVSNDVHNVNDGGPLDNVDAQTPNSRCVFPGDELRNTKESCQSVEGKKLNNLVSQAKCLGTKNDFDVSRVVSKVEDAVLDRHFKERVCGDPVTTKLTTAIKTGVEDQSTPSRVGTTGEMGDAILSATAVPIASPGLVHSGGSPVDSTDRTLKTDLSGVKIRSPNEAEMSIRGLQIASLEEEDVKVCDICGDAGYEECLTVCSVCNEGAEHIYCMQALHHSRPAGWICEECKLKEQNGSLKKMEDVPRKDYVPPKTVYPSPKKKQIIGNTRSRLSALLDKGKGTYSQKVATKGPLATPLSTKRPADDLHSLPALKKQVRENTGIPSTGTSSFTPRAPTRENSLKAPDSGKVKFLSPIALASCPAGGGGRTLGKSSSFVGLSSQSVRPGLNQLSQVAGKSRYVSNGGALSDSVAPPKQPSAVPRPPSFNAVAPTSSAVRSGGSQKANEPLPSFLVSSRPGSFATVAKGSKEGNSEGNGPQSFGRDKGSQLMGGGSTKGWSPSSSGKMATKRIDTPRPMTQSTDIPRSGTFGRQFSMKGDSLISSQAADNTGMPGRPPVKRLQTTDPAKGLNRLSSFSRLANQQSSREDAQRNSEGQMMRGSRKIPKVIDSCDTGTPRTSQKLSSENSLDVDLIRKGQQAEDVLRAQNSVSPGRVVGNGVKSTLGASPSELPVSEDTKKPSKVSMRATAMKRLVVDEVPKGSFTTGKDLKWKDNSETGRTTAKNRRCYICRETGHSAQECSSRSTPSTLALADHSTSIVSGPVATSNPKEGLEGLSVSLGEKKSSPHSSVAPHSLSPVLDTEPKSSVVISEMSTIGQQRQSKDAECGLVQGVSTYPAEDKKKQISTPVVLSQGGTLARVVSQTGPPLAFTASGDLQSVRVGYSSALENSISREGLFPVPTPSGGLAALGALTETRKSDTVANTIQGISPWHFKEAQLVSYRKMNTQGGLQTPAPPPPLIPPVETPPPIPLMRQMRGIAPWGGQLASPQPSLGVDQGSWGKRVESVMEYEVAVPESQSLWSGGFEVVSAAVPAWYDGIHAYSSSFAAPQVRTVTEKLPSTLQLEEVRRKFSADAWPTQFQRKPPTDKEIALYFFPEGESMSSFEAGYMRLLEHMMAFDLVLMGQVEGAELLIFPSRLLPAEFHHWKSKMFLWGVYRARKSSPAVKPMPLEPVPTPMSVVPLGPHKVAPPGAVVIAPIADAGEADMEIDMIDDIEPYAHPKQPVCPQPPALSIPPLPHEPPPVQPPPPDLTAPGLEEKDAPRAPGAVGGISREGGLIDLDLPPGFGPGPQKQASPPSGTSDMDIRPSGPSEVKRDDSGTPPGFGGVALQTLVHAEETVGSTTDVDNLQVTNQVGLKRGSNIGELSRPTLSSRNMSPLPAPSSSPRNCRDDSTGTFWLPTHKRSQSTSKSPNRHRDRMKDQAGGRTSFNGRESGRDRESGKGRDRGRDRERGKDRERGRGNERRRDRYRERQREDGRDREQDKEAEREKDKERRRERWHHWERENGKGKDTRSLGNDRGKHKDYRHDSQDKDRERDDQQTRSCSQSRSRSRSFSTSRPRLQSLSVSPPKRRSSGKSNSRHRSRSYSNSPDSIHGRFLQKPRSSEALSRSREQSQDGVSFSSGKRGTGHLDDIDRDRKLSPRDGTDWEGSQKSRLSVFTREGSLRTRDSAMKGEFSGADELLGDSSIPFYGMHEDRVESGPMDHRKETLNSGSVPYYHVFLPAETHNGQMLENDKGYLEAGQPLSLSSNRRLSPGASKRPRSDLQQGSGQCKSNKVVECPSYEFFPVKAEKVGVLGEPSTNPSLELVLGEREGTGNPESEPQPFFVQLVDSAVSSPEPSHRYADSIRPLDETVEFPLVTGTRQEPTRPDIGSLNLSLSVPQYRKHGNMWVKIEDAQALLGDEDVNFALTL